MPLVPLGPHNGPTELQPGSHKWQDGAQGPKAATEDESSRLSPALHVGEMLIFNYKTFHRGRANLSLEPRPISYLVYATRQVRDRHNFPVDAPLLGSTRGAVPVSAADHGHMYSDSGDLDHDGGVVPLRE